MFSLEVFNNQSTVTWTSNNSTKINLEKILYNVT